MRIHSLSRASQLARWRSRQMAKLFFRGPLTVMRAQFNFYLHFLIQPHPGNHSPLTGFQPSEPRAILSAAESNGI